jgi:hypothetical protein
MRQRCFSFVQRAPHSYDRSNSFSVQEVISRAQSFLDWGMVLPFSI